MTNAAVFCNILRQQAAAALGCGSVDGGLVALRDVRSCTGSGAAHELNQMVRELRGPAAATLPEMICSNGGYIKAGV